MSSLDSTITKPRLVKDLGIQVFPETSVATTGAHSPRITGQQGEKNE